MKITANTLCNDRVVRVSEHDLFVSYWGGGFLCCDACVSIARTRDSWGEVYA